MDGVAATNALKVQVTNRQVLSIALPISFAILIPQLNLLTNSIFLGHYDAESLGNAGVTGVFYLIFAVAGHGLNNGVQSVLSRYAGSGNTDAFKTILTQGVRISIFFALAGIVITWGIAPFILKQVADPVAYPKEMAFLRIRILGLPFLYLFQMGNAFLVASLNSRYLIYGFIAEASVNVLLDYLLIFGNWGFPEMGFNGAAVASVIAEVFGMLLVMTVLLRTGLKKKYALLQNLRYNKLISREVLVISAPLVVQFVISVTTWLTFFILIESRHDEIAKAVSNTMRNIFGIGGVFVWAFSGTCNTMVSNLRGQGRYDLVVSAINKIMLWSMALCFSMCLIANLFPGLFFGLFGQGEAFVQAGVPVLRVVTLGMMIMSAANIWLNGVTGTGKTKVNLAIEIAAIAVYLIYTWVFMKLHYVSLAMAWSNEVVYWSTIFLLAFTFIKSGKWKPAGA
ncbi:MAG TPA: MATE family efflux transporter [Ferruginibacter sp.]|nr:MATE family efflux transporter [Ferruginibacter sp.]HMP22069.1 MATE family efflux transporter [Ferruginibacter sp.]